ncbi:MAG: hypothetical protein WBB39_02680 [Candidatus Saccharimonadales bacterium]
MRPLGNVACRILSVPQLLVVSSTRCIPVDGLLRPDTDQVFQTVFGAQYDGLDIVRVDKELAVTDELEEMMNGTDEFSPTGHVPVARFRVYDEIDGVEGSLVELYPYVAVPLIGSDLVVTRSSHLLLPGDDDGCITDIA